MSLLDTPLRLRCGVTIANRLAVAPLTNKQSNPDGTLHDDELRWLERRAEGGWGLVSTCAAFVSQEGRAWVGQLGVASDRHLPGLTRLAEAMVAAGTTPIVQLHHAGAKATQAVERLGTTDGENQRSATKGDIGRVISDFVAAALRAEQAGFAGVEVHGANGYLFTQFLAPADNPRNDGYGGGLEGRARFLRETVRAVRAAVRPGFIVGVRLSPVDSWARQGLMLADGVKVASWMAEDGVDFVHLSLGDASGPPPHEPGAGAVTRVVRSALPHAVALFAAGGIKTRECAERALQTGADVAAVGRFAIIHPDWPRVSSDPGFSPTELPWTPDDLRAVDVGPALLRYLHVFPGFVVGGAPPRG